MILLVALPSAASAGPLKAAAERMGRELGSTQVTPEPRSRARLWTGIGLLAAGGVLATLGSIEIGDDETGPDDGEDADNSDDGEDSDGWGNKALIGGGVAAATVGGLVLITGRKSGPAVTARRGGVAVRHTVRF
jgi:hypothetical protein